jgi:hypothetical protein
MSSPSNQVGPEITATEAALKAKLLAEINAGKTFWSEHRGAITLAAGAALGAGLVFLGHKVF